MFDVKKTYMLGYNAITLRNDLRALFEMFLRRQIATLNHMLPTEPLITTVDQWFDWASTNRFDATCQVIAFLGFLLETGKTHLEQQRQSP